MKCFCLTSVSSVSLQGLVGGLSDLRALQDSLADIQYLHTSLQCPITLTEYQSVSWGRGRRRGRICIMGYLDMYLAA